MKKLIITTAIILSASLTFYAKQSGITNTAQVLKADRLNNENDLSLNFNKTHKMDISQADVK